MTANDRKFPLPLAVLRAVPLISPLVPNDIDGTDPIFGHATGTPEPGGLTPSTVERLIQCAAGEFPVWGSDLVEVAPPLAGHSPREPGTTLGTAVRYIETQARAALRS